MVESNFVADALPDLVAPNGSAVLRVSPRLSGRTARAVEAVRAAGFARPASCSRARAPLSNRRRTELSELSGNFVTERSFRVSA